jgi:thiol-disulfide isomerase/thioredoxin
MSKTMNKTLHIILIILFSITELHSQNTLTGSFSALGNQPVRLVGFDGFGIYTIDSVKASANGAFTMSFSEKDYGMAYLATDDNKSFIIVLANEKMHITGESFANPESIRISGSKENELFGRYATEHPRREQALSAWDYLQRIYQKDSLFAVHELPVKAIEKERTRIQQEDRMFLKQLDSNSYVRWYLPVRKLVSSAGVIAQYRTDELPAAIEQFRQLDYTDPRFYKSGLLREAIEAHFWLIENSGRSLDSVYVEMNKSIDRMMLTLISDEKKFNEITDFLFKLLEKRSLFGSSEYLAVKVLNEQSCTINNDLAAQLESYRAMKNGNIAADIVFEGDVIEGEVFSTVQPKKLSNLKSRFSLIVFGASWCPACSSELAQINQFYSKWKTQGVEVLFVSLDENKKDFYQFAGSFPFISICDYKKWESPVVKNYHVFATPTMYLLDANRKLILKPNSAKHVDSWIDWFLIQGHYQK